jgi:hypothetical protein
MNPWMVFEVGAARSWDKPIYVVVTDPATIRLPPGLKGARLYTAGKIQDLVRAIKRSDEPLSEDEMTRLHRLYAEAGVPLDELTLGTERKGSLARRFNRGRDKAMSEERLLSELFRMRKQGVLVERRPPKRSRSRRDPT